MKVALSVIAAILLLSLFFFAEAAMNESPSPVNLEWYGHSCFLLTLNNGAKILLDPYDMTRLPYSLPAGRVDVTFSTHDHFDHNAVNAVPSGVILRAKGSEATFFGSKSGFKTLPDGSIQVDIKGTSLNCLTVPSYHDDHQGGQRGVNGLIRFTVAGLNFVHLGDLGDTLNAEQIANLKPVDILMIPVGGFYTIDAHQAKKVVEQLSPKVVIPMHYKTSALPKEGFPITTVDDFLAGYSNIKHEPGSTISFTADHLPERLTIEVPLYHGQK
jgi:L-ascorbate metabolism protein UlaG (beta-lactamase superfamily)